MTLTATARMTRKRRPLKRAWWMKPMNGCALRWNNLGIVFPFVFAALGRVIIGLYETIEVILQ